MAASSFLYPPAIVILSEAKNPPGDSLHSISEITSFNAMNPPGDSLNSFNETFNLNQRILCAITYFTQ